MWPTEFYRGFETTLGWTLGIMGVIAALFILDWLKNLHLGEKVLKILARGIGFLIASGQKLKRVPWGSIIGAIIGFSFACGCALLFIFGPSLYLLWKGVFTLTGVGGVAAAGALIGLIIAIPLAWEVRRQGWRAQTAEALVMTCVSTWGTTVLMAFLVLLKFVR